jgi:hypothetical protein
VIAKGYAVGWHWREILAWPPRPTLAGISVPVAAAVVWTADHLMNIESGHQFALIGTVLSLVLAALGPAIFYRWLPALGLLFFMLSSGDPLRLRRAWTRSPVVPARGVAMGRVARLIFGDLPGVAGRRWAASSSALSRSGSCVVRRWGPTGRSGYSARRVTPAALYGRSERRQNELLPAAWAAGAVRPRIAHPQRTPRRQ